MVEDLRSPVVLDPLDVKPFSRKKGLGPINTTEKFKVILERGKYSVVKWPDFLLVGKLTVKERIIPASSRLPERVLKI